MIAQCWGTCDSEPSSSPLHFAHEGKVLVAWALGWGELGLREGGEQVGKHILALADLSWLGPSFPHMRYEVLGRLGTSAHAVPPLSWASYRLSCGVAVRNNEPVL